MKTIKFFSVSLLIAFMISIRAAGTAFEMSIDKMVKLIRGAGKIPAQRNTKYEILKRF